MEAQHSLFQQCHSVKSRVQTAHTISSYKAQAQEFSGNEGRLPFSGSAASRRTADQTPSRGFPLFWSNHRSDMRKV